MTLSDRFERHMREDTHITHRPSDQLGDKRMTKTSEAVVEQLHAHGIELGNRYRDPASGFEGTATALYFFQHGCLRVNLRGTNKSTSEAVEVSFDAPELVDITKPVPKPVPAGSRTGGPHDLAPMTRPGPR